MNLRFIVRNRLYLPAYWILGLRYLWLFKIRNRHIRTGGIVFVMRGAEIYARRGYGSLEIGRWTWIGAGSHIRCHEGSLRIGDKCVLGGVTVNCYNEVTIGDECIFGEWITLVDFDHRYDRLDLPIRKQGIVTAPVHVGRDCWFGEKSTVLRGVTIGDGCVIGSHALVNRDVPALSVVAGVPARVIAKRE